MPLIWLQLLMVQLALMDRLAAQHAGDTASSIATTDTREVAAAKPSVVLFACIQNAGRSQMAKALFNMLVDPASATAISAGSRPAEHVHPEVVDVMGELGIDLTAAEPQKLTPEVAATAQILVTMGCGEECPYVPGVKIVAWRISDPQGKSVDEVRVLRELLKQEVLQLVTVEGFKLRTAA